MRHAVVAVGLVVLAAFATGCSASCEDACDRLAECGARLNPGSSATPEQLAACVEECEAGICGPAQTDTSKNDEALDCLADLDCETEQSASVGLQECAAHCL